MFSPVLVQCSLFVKMSVDGDHTEEEMDTKSTAFPILLPSFGFEDLECLQTNTLVLFISNLEAKFVSSWL